MTPKFAQAIDPVMLHVLGLLERIAQGERPAAVDERLRIRGLIDQAEALLGASEQWRLGKYALAAWIDEMLVDAPWDGRDWWSNNVLEMELFNSRECYDRFYILAKEASTLSTRDALEAFYICVVLGFRGLYRDPEFSASTIQQLGLPPNVEAWARQAAMAIRLGQGRPTIAGKKTRPLRSAAAPRPPHRALDDAGLRNGRNGTCGDAVVLEVADAASVGVARAWRSGTSQSPPIARRVACRLRLRQRDRAPRRETSQGHQARVWRRRPRSPCQGHRP